MLCTAYICQRIQAVLAYNKWSKSANTGSE
jgi:hypothetical protein